MMITVIRIVTAITITTDELILIQLRDENNDDNVCEHTFI